MRRVRITFEGAYHHVMNRGYNGNPIFKERNNKYDFLDFLKLYSEKLEIKLFAYCLMDNHYHLILENCSGRMSDFIKQLNGNFGRLYRRRHGGKGYVFQGRYKSILIQDDSHLFLAIAYLLNNPVRAGMVKKFFQYEWSSASAYYNKRSSNDIVDRIFVENLFGDRNSLIRLVNHSGKESLPVIGTRLGKILGEKSFVEAAIKKFDRRINTESLERKRTNDVYFDPVDKIIMEIEKKYMIKLEQLDRTTYSGKKIRGELLMHLRDKGGLKYSEIIIMDLFSDLKLHSLGKLYKRARAKDGKM